MFPIATSTKKCKFAALLSLVALLATACNYAFFPFLSRVDGPVVLTMADLGIPNFGLKPDRVIAYRWDDGASDWLQIPVQVDERVSVDFGVQPANNNSAGVSGTIYGSGVASGVTVLVYADPNTWVGADNDPDLDANDEIVFMARDAGPQAPAAEPHPALSTNSIGWKAELTDPDGGTAGYVYFFYGPGGVDQSAGVDHVAYNFSLDAGTYKNNYKRADGPNPESSTVVTDNYTMGFSDRWITDRLENNWGTGVDVLDGHKSRFSFSTCGRSNQTFANSEGAFIANIDGPVRAIRSYIGANSGPLTQRTEYFYEDRYEQVTDLRVHAIPSIMSFWDWSAAASGMTYTSSEEATPITIDGTDDTVSSTAASWEALEGPQGGFTMATSFSSSFGTSIVQTWNDDTTPSFSECWGDGSIYGGNGQFVTSSLPNTDPRNAVFGTLQVRSVLGVWPATTNTAEWGATWAPDALQDLLISGSQY